MFGKKEIFCAECKAHIKASIRFEQVLKITIEWISKSSKYAVTSAGYTTLEYCGKCEPPERVRDGSTTILINGTEYVSASSLKYERKKVESLRQHLEAQSEQLKEQAKPAGKPLTSTKKGGRK